MILMKNLKKNCLVFWKVTWGIWQFFTRALKSLKIETFMEYFYPKEKNVWAWNLQGVMCYGNEEWCTVWKGIDFSFQNWHEEFNKFWLEHSKISKTCTLMSRFWPKYIMFHISYKLSCNTYSFCCIKFITINFFHRMHFWH